MKIVVLEKIEMTKAQALRLKELGTVSWYDGSTDEEAKQRIAGADVVIVDWVDPSSFILDMKVPSVVALMSTGYGWIKHRQEARKRGILICNVPGYATEAVAEHILGLTLCVTRLTMVGDRAIRAGKTEKGYLRGFELKDRNVGIIGLGQIGGRAAELFQAFGCTIQTHNRHPKDRRGISNAPLDDLVRTSDVVCVTCPCNDETRGMLSKKRLDMLKPDAVVVGATWDIVVLRDLIPILEKRLIRGFAFDAAIEGGRLDLPSELLKLDNVVLTPHVGYDTAEAKVRQVDTCLSNIEAFIQRGPTNVVNDEY